MHETTKLFGSTKILTDKTKNGENVQSPEVVEVVLVKCNLINVGESYWKMLNQVI